MFRRVKRGYDFGAGVLPTRPFLIYLRSGMHVTTNYQLVARDVAYDMFGETANSGHFCYRCNGVRVRDGIFIKKKDAVVCNIAVNRGSVITTNSIIAGSIPTNDMIKNIPTGVVNAFRRSVGGTRLFDDGFENGAASCSITTLLGVGPIRFSVSGR